MRIVILPALFPPTFTVMHTGIHVQTHPHMYIHATQSMSITTLTPACMYLLQCCHVDMYTSHCAGFLFIVNPFQDGCQHYWVRRCLVDYPLLPNQCNLDAHSQRLGTGQLWATERCSTNYAPCTALLQMVASN